MKLEPESVIVCEGYHDRSFLGGLLRQRGCEELKNKPYRDGKRVTGKGQYAFRTPGGGWLRIVPTHGDKNLLDAAEVELRARMTAPLLRLVIVRDDDSEATTTAALVERDPQRAALERWAERIGAQRVLETDEFELEGGVRATRLSFMIWRALDAAGAHLPAQQTLERLVCAAIADAHGPRCKAVETWIASRPAPPAGDKLHKTHAASHMAGWFSDRGYEGFFGAVWEDEAIRDALLRRLTATRAARIIDALVDG